MELEIRREYFPNGTNGVLYAGKKKICHTIELPWKDNRQRVSCIPPGRYKLLRRWSAKFGWHCIVAAVNGRSGILIHAFNDALVESKGCIAPVTRIDGEGQGSSSRKALDKLMSFLAPVFDRSKPVYLTIKNDDYEVSNKKSTKKNA